MIQFCWLDRPLTPFLMTIAARKNDSRRDFQIPLLRHRVIREKERSVKTIAWTFVLEPADGRKNVC